MGFIVDESGTRFDPDKISPIMEYPRPKNMKQLRRYLGMCSWFLRYLPKYSTIAESLLKLTRKDVPYVWDTACEDAFCILREKLTSAPILARPSFQKEYVIECDASNTGLDSVLLQREEDGSPRVIAYASRTLTASERIFFVTERELLAILFSIRKFRCYVKEDHFRVISDHSCLQWIFKLQNPSGRLARWALELQQ